MKLLDKVKKRLNINLKESKLINELMKVPKLDNKTNMPKHEAFEKNAVHQLDVLYLPHDNKHKYALTVIDVYDKTADCQPITNKTSKTIVEALDKIYSRGYLSKPTMFMQVDDGSEFKGLFTKYANDNNILIRRALPNRHRQQAVIESFKGNISKINI